MSSLHDLKNTYQMRVDDFKRITNHIYDLVGEIKVTGEIVYISPSVKKVLGYTQEELVGKQFRKFISKDFTLVKMDKQPLNTFRYECNIIKKDGSHLPVDCFITYVLDQEKKEDIFIFVARDESQHKKIIDELERKDRLLLAVSNASNVLITNDDFHESVYQALKYLGEATNVDRCYIFENHPLPETGEPATSQRFEWSIDSVVPQINNPELQNVIYGEAGLSWWNESLLRNEPINSLVKDLPEGGRAVLEPQGILSILVIPIKIGKKLWGFIGFDDCQKERTWSKTEESILTVIAASFGGIVKRRLTDEELQKTLLELFSLNETLEEKVKKAIIETQQKDLLIQQQSRQAAMGEIINSIAHQWRQPLNGISLMASNIQLDAELMGGELDEIKNQADSIIQLVDNMSRTITDFMEFFNDNQFPMTFSMKETIRGILDLVQSQRYNRNIELVEDYCEDDSIHSYRTEVQQMLINLIINGIQAFDEKEIENRLIYVSTRKELGIDSQPYIVVRIRDNAGGIKEENMEKIFQPYFTTKQKGKGTGIGLSISKKIVEDRLNGTITAENKDDGALFTVYIPTHSN